MQINLLINSTDLTFEELKSILGKALADNGVPDSQVQIVQAADEQPGDPDDVTENPPTQTPSQANALSPGIGSSAGQRQPSNQ